MAWWSDRRSTGPGQLPPFPWDLLAPHAAVARRHPGGIVDLSIGTPVDSTPEVLQAALRAASDAPGYPTAAGLPELRAACAAWMTRRLGVTGDAAVVPVVGTKELVALLGFVLGLGPGDDVLIPALAYPTYAVGATLAGARPVLEPTPSTRLVWLNSPGNPTGAVASAAELKEAVDWARANDVLVVSDECYVELGWEKTPVSVLHPDVCGPTHSGVLAVHSLSKRSHAAGFRSGFVAGDAAAVAAITEVRKHSGLLMPTPVQTMSVVAWADDAHVEVTRETYAGRREVFRPALEKAGYRVDHSDAGLYFWVTRDEDCWATVARLADLGILAAPGSFYGDAGGRHVRMAMTATDERIAAAADRLLAV